MEGNSRAKKSVKNSAYAVISKLFVVVLSFIVRTVFIYTLGKQYLGINGLFSNIITMLSLADLGIGIAIPYTLYAPLGNKDYEKIKILMKFYSKMYNVIGTIVLIIGIALLPFLDIFVKSMPDIPNIQLIYVLFVVNSAISYFFVYKKMLIDSDQKGYISSKIIMRVTALFNIAQIIMLVLTKNYILYLVLNIVTVLVQNIIISNKCDKMYPYIKEKTNNKIDKKDIKELTHNISALVIYKIGVVILNGTDNIIISKMIGVIEVGLYSNYLLIFNSLYGIVSQIFSSITSSIGNMVVTDDEKKSESILKKLQFLNFVIFSTCSTCLFILLNSFIRLWVGEEYVLSTFTAFLVALNFYVYGMQSVVSSFRNAYGLFVQGKYRPIVMVIVNIIISIVFAKYIGIPGVIVGTILSRLFVIGIWDPIVVYKYGFKMKVKQFFIDYYKYLAIFLGIALLMWSVFKNIYISNLIMFCIMGIAVITIYSLILFALYGRSDNFKYFYEKISKIIKKKIGDKHGKELS